MSDPLGRRLNKLDVALEAGHVRRYVAEAGAAGRIVPTRDDATADEVAAEVVAVAAAYGMTPAALRRLLAADAATFRRGASYADLRVARLVPHPVADRERPREGAPTR